MSEVGNNKFTVSEIIPFFVPDPRLRLGASQSGHGVEFGRLKNKLVAAKPYFGDNSEAKALYEQRMTDTIQKAGFFTLDILGVETIEEYQCSVLFSEYKLGFIGCNGLFLESEPNTAVGKEVSRAVSSIAESLAALHVSRFTHGDPHTRNFGFRQGSHADQEPLLFDLEKATAHSDDSPFFDQAIKNELTKFSYSLGRRMYGGKDPNLAFIGFNESVVTPYCETFIELSREEKKIIPDLFPVAENAINKFKNTYEEQATNS